MNYLDYIKKKWNDMLKDKVSEKQEETGGGSTIPKETETPKETEKPKEEVPNVETPDTNSGGDDKKEGSGNPYLDEIEWFIDQQYKVDVYEKPSLPEVPQYERMDTNFTSDKDIEKNAEKMLGDYANQSKNAIDEEIAALAKKYQSDLQSQKDNYKNQQESLEDIYETVKEDASNNLLKRGLARSSIAANVVSSLEKELGEKKASALKGYIDSVNNLESELASLEGKRQNALNNFNISYAAKLTEQIIKLTEQRDDQVKEALKYNNTLTEKEHNQSIQKELDESKLYTDELTQAQKEKDLGTLSSAQRARIQENIYEKMDEVLATMPQKEAKKLLDEAEVFEQLTSYYYYKLYDKYGRD